VPEYLAWEESFSNLRTDVLSIRSDRVGMFGSYA